MIPQVFPAKWMIFPLGLSQQVMEAIPNGELFDLITAEGQAMTDGTMRRLVHGIINGMAELCALDGGWDGVGDGG